MKIQEKINYLQNNCFGRWMAMRRIVEDELSEKQNLFCICGRLATGLHEMNCRKFNTKINNETVKRLNNLIKL